MNSTGSWRCRASTLILAAAVGPFGIQPALAQKAYIPSFNSNFVAVVDIAAGRQTGSIAIDGGNPPNPVALAVTPDSHTAYVVESDANAIVAVTLATGAMSASPVR